METGNSAPNGYVSRDEFDNICNQLADALEIISDILENHATIDSYGVHKIGELSSAIREIKKDQFL